MASDAEVDVDAIAFEDFESGSDGSDSGESDIEESPPLARRHLRERPAVAPGPIPEPASLSRPRIAHTSPARPSAVLSEMVRPLHRRTKSETLIDRHPSEPGGRLASRRSREVLGPAAVSLSRLVIEFPSFSSLRSQYS